MARRVLHDAFFKKAKAEGYVARSAYKLTEIQEKRALIRRGDRVLDLGCAPGSWMQVAEELTGERGVVVGVDLQEVRHVFGPTVHTIVGDAFALDPGVLRGASGNRFDVLLSDMAPSTTGHGDDHLSVRLCRRVLELAPAVLRKGGTLCMKVLEGEEFPALLKECRGVFRECGASKPAASREVSREIFIWATGFSPPRPAPAEPRA